jgi:hypothetical protein
MTQRGLTTGRHCPGRSHHPLALPIVFREQDVPTHPKKANDCRNKKHPRIARQEKLQDSGNVLPGNQIVNPKQSEEHRQNDVKSIAMSSRGPER